MPLKAVLIGPRGTVFKEGKVHPGLLSELVLFIRRMNAKGVHVGLWSQHPVGYRQQDRLETVEAYLSRQSGTQVPFYHANYGQLPARRYGGSVNPIVQQIGVQPHEVILVGNDKEDMLAGVNTNLLLLRPNWYPGETTG
jgi:methionine salvage enolase-phosphatase E1